MSTLAAIATASVLTLAMASEKATPAPAPTFFNQNDPSSASPFGKVHPDAPPEAAQFQFLVGEFECDDRLQQPDGTWKESKATWITRYMLNGHGIHDAYRNDTFAGASVRVWSTQEKNWRVAFYGMPGDYYGLEWKGKKEGDNMVMRRHFKNAAGVAVESVLTFYNITPTSFDWKNLNKPEGQKPFTTWEISCKRKR